MDMQLLAVEIAPHTQERGFSNTLRILFVSWGPVRVQAKALSNLSRELRCPSQDLQGCQWE